jgi:hypothetical protein
MAQVAEKFPAPSVESEDLLPCSQAPVGPLCTT